MVVGLIYYTILLLYPLYIYKQLYRLQRLFLLNIFAKSYFQAVFFQVVVYSFLDILQRYLQYQCQSISNLLEVFLLVKFLCSISPASLLSYSVNIKSNPYRYVIYSYCPYIFCPIELQPVYKCFLYKCQINCALLSLSFLGRFTS